LHEAKKKLDFLKKKCSEITFHISQALVTT